MPWLYFMGIVLFWVHDPTADASATRRVVARTSPLVVRAISLSRLPAMRTMLDDIVVVMGEAKHVFTERRP
jgi:hypothetical protein